MFAFKHYDNPSAVDDKEFFEDISRIKYIKKLLTRYKTSGDLKERLILNHLIILSNVFGRDALAKIIWLKMEDQLDMIKPFMICLGILPERIYNVNGKTHETDDIPLDYEIIKVLRNIKNG
jgi:hypothetical protein